MADSFHRLRLYAVIGRHDENRDIRHVSASRTHGRKCLMTRRVEEDDTLTVMCDLRRTDMLSDAARFAGSNAGMADLVEKRSLSVIDMSHDSDDRRSRSEILFSVGEMLNTFFDLFFLHLADDDLLVKFISEDLNRVLIEVLIDIGHDSHPHQCHDDSGCGYIDLLGEALDCNRNCYNNCSCRDCRCRFFRSSGVFLTLFLSVILSVLVLRFRHALISASAVSAAVAAVFPVVSSA